MLWNLGKILERAIVYFYSDSVIPSIGSDQSAYQKGKSTTDAVMSAIDKLTDMLNQPNAKSLPVDFLDMTKVFDRMDKSKLIEKLAERGVNRKLVTIIHSFLSGRTQQVKLGEHRSSTLTTKNGTPQGTLLGPLFWLLYIDSLCPSSSTAVKYADDLTLTPNSIANSKSDLQNTIDEVTRWCDEHNMIANPKKSVIINLSNIHNRYVPPSENFTMQGEQITTETSAKFLGVTVDEHLTFKEHVDNIVKKVRKLIYTLLDLKRSGIPFDMLRTFYIACIRPSILYASPAWFTLTTHTQRLRIERLENLALKIIRPDTADYADRVTSCNITPILDLMNEQYKQYIDKIIQNDNHCLHKTVLKYKPAPPTRPTRQVKNSSTKPSTRTKLRYKSPLIQCWVPE